MQHRATEIIPQLKDKLQQETLLKSRVYLNTILYPFNFDFFFCGGGASFSPNIDDDDDDDDDELVHFYKQKSIP